MTDTNFTLNDDLCFAVACPDCEYIYGTIEMDGKTYEGYHECPKCNKPKFDPNQLIEVPLTEYEL